MRKAKAWRLTLRRSTVRFVSDVFANVVGRALQQVRIEDGPNGRTVYAHTEFCESPAVSEGTRLVIGGRVYASTSEWGRAENEVTS